MIRIELEPFTGAPMHSHIRVQFNMLITKVEKFKLMKNFPDALLPILWIDEVIILPDWVLKDIRLSFRLILLAK